MNGPGDTRAVPPLDTARDLLRRGDVAEAAAIVEATLSRSPDDADALYLRGLVANRQRDFPAAIEALRRGIASRPAAPLPWLALGNAYARSDDFMQAAMAYREVIAREPEWADAHYNLGLMLKRLGDPAAGMRSLYAAWLLDPMLFDAARQCIATVAQMARSGSVETVSATLALPAAPPSVSIVVCSIDETKLERVLTLYRRLFAAIPHEIIAIRDARSLAEAYNRAVATSGADVVVLSHDDVDVLAPDFAARLLSHLNTCDVVGIVGSTRMTGPAIGWSGHPHLRGWITHHAPGDVEWRVDVLHPRPVAEGLMSLDGVFLAARREVFAKLPFDAVTFDGFHLYDVDWTYRAASEGMRLTAVGDLELVHASRGTYHDAWQRYADRFSAKHALAPVPPTESAFFGATLENAAQARAFFAQLSLLSRASAS
jgi:Tfp pilus assembly protein PilF